MAKIILIRDLVDTRARKQKELDFYTTQLEELKAKMAYVQKEIGITTYIIDLIEKEQLIDFTDYVAH